MKIRTQIMVLFLVSIMLTTGLAVSAATFFGRRAYYDKVEEASAQTLQAVTVALEQMMSDIRRDINVLFWNTMIQNQLEKLEDTSMTPEIRRDIQDLLSSVLLSEDSISSILFWDNHGDCCYSYREGVMLKSDKPIQEAYWYPDVQAAGGEWIYETDGGGIATYSNDNRNVISMMRTMKLKSDYSVCGLIMVNIDEKTLSSRIASIAGGSQRVALLSDAGILYESEPAGGELQEHFAELRSCSSGQKLTFPHGKEELLYRKMSLKEGEWQLVSETRIDSGLDVNDRLMAVILAGNIVFLLLCWMLITRLVSSPLEEMTRQLERADGVPKNFVVAQKKKDEINTLKKAYNQMLTSIRELMVRTAEEEKSIQRGELELILSQVSPHFLYNTLDTISGMVLSGDERRSFELVQQLGRFYRNSLNGGQQLVTLREELETVKSYLNILNTRYGGTIRGEYEVPEALENRRILKLMLQPLIENAVHHGLRPRGVDGIVIITVREADGEMILSVWDDGVGMSQEKIQKILKSTKEDTPGFGIFSIRQRIQLFYEVEDPLTIESREGQWTKITIRIPGGEVQP